MKHIIDINGFYVGFGGSKTELQEGQSEVAFAPPIDLIKPKWNGTEWIEGATPEEILNKKREQVPLFDFYPNSETNYKTLQLDNLEGIKRSSTLADKGLKGEKKYYKDDVLVWSSEKKYWFQEDGYAGGFRRIIRIFNILGEVHDSWEVFYDLSQDDKELFLEEQRRMIFHYFKSQQAELFNFLYAFFKEEIDNYVVKGGNDLANVLIWAQQNHPYQDENQNYIVRLILSQEIPTQSGGTVSVLQGILYELV